MPILLAEHDPDWSAAFEAEAGRIAAALDGVALRIEHVGSTAVAGLAAKPVIDIQVSVADPAALDAYRPPLEALGYTFTTVPLPYFHRPSQWPHTHHLHVRRAGSPEESGPLAFRDWLRRHPGDRAAYETLKRGLARDADADSVSGRARYSDAKTAFIRAIGRRSGAAR
jgi:GrpB-like predicted nucleotidyltransferase (UPF0157 family)